MAIQLNDNIKVNAGKPVDVKYLNLSNATYTGTTEVISIIPVPERHIGLTVNVNNNEYWFSTGVTDGDLVIKTTASASTISNVQNIGVGEGIFSGITANGVIKLRSIIGSGSTTVTTSGETIVVSSIDLTNLQSDILEFNSSGEKYQPYSAYTSGVTFYYGTTPPTGLTRLNLNAQLEVTELRVSSASTHTNHNVGDIYWDNDDSTISLQQTTQVKQQVGQELYVKVKNDTAGLIVNGSVVYVDGSDSGRPTIKLARANELDVATVDEVIGMVTENITAGQEGFVTTSGLVRDLVTSGFTEGDVVYLSTTGYGEITNVKPTYPDFIIEVGIVTNVDPTGGTVLIRINNISNPQIIRGVEIVNSVNYTATTRSDFLSVYGGRYVYFPSSPLTGQEITISDADGDAENFTITICGNGNYINGNISNPNDIAIINSNWGTMSFIYNGLMWHVSNITP
jgi:hypothetical protein